MFMDGSMQMRHGCRHGSRALAVLRRCSGIPPGAASAAQGWAFLPSSRQIAGPVTSQTLYSASDRCAMPPLAPTESQLLECCASRAWATAVAALGSYLSVEELIEAARQAWWHQVG